MKLRPLLLAFLLVSGIFASAQTTHYQLSSHILDITRGKPAAGVRITLSKMETGGGWTVIDDKRTDENGRIKDFLKEDGKDHSGIYKLTFFTRPYFEQQGLTSFYPFIEIPFELNGKDHYHVPITLTPFGYSTYRGN